MIGIVSGVKMRNANVGCDTGPADRCDRGVKLRVIGIAKPVRIAFVERESRILLVLAFAGLCQRLAALGRRSSQPFLLDIRFSECRRESPRNAEPLLHQGMADVPD